MSGQLLTVVAALCALVAMVALVAAAVSLAGGHRPQDPATHLGYLAVSVVLLPLLLGLPGRRDPGPGPARRPARVEHLVAAVAAGVGLVVSVRLHTTWRA